MHEPKPHRRVVIIGGVAGGASCATRLRRLDETAEIIVFEKGPHVSFANCGLPYFVGDVIRNAEDLLVASPDLFRRRFAIDVRPLQEVVGIDRAAKTLAVIDTRTGREYHEPYDVLVLATGARPIRPPLPGIEGAGIFAVRTVPDAERVRAWIDEHDAKEALIVGAGFIGCELAENLILRGLSVTMVELAPQVLPPFDPEIAVTAAEELRRHAVQLRIGDAVASFAEDGDRQRVTLKSGASLSADIVLLCIGITPESALAKAAGLEIGPRGHVRVDGAMRTSDPDIYAVGDAVQVKGAVTLGETSIPLAGPANRQGRIAADNICDRSTRFRGIQGTAVCGVFDLTMAMTGESEKSLARQRIRDYETIYLHPGHHVGYFPGAKKMHVKLLFHRGDGRVLGAQACGEAGVERRIDVIAAFIQKNGTVFDLEEAELCYAPQYGAAKDPVNMAGMIAANVMRGDTHLASWHDVPDGKPQPGGFEPVVLDVRSAEEFACDGLARAINVPIDDLRTRMSELPLDRPVWVTCAVGQRAYNATRILRQHGVDAHLLPGGMETRAELRRAGIVG